MDTIKLKDLTFKPYISSAEIATAVKNVAARINEDLFLRPICFVRSTFPEPK